MSDQKSHVFKNISGTIDEKFTPSVVQRAKLLFVNLKFSDVLTQDTLYINILDKNDNVIAQYGLVLFIESSTATNFTWCPPEGSFKLIPGWKIQVVFANNDARILSVPESNVSYEFI